MLRLRDEHAIERVAVMQRQVADGQRVLKRDWQLMEALQIEFVWKHVVERPLGACASQCSFNADFTNADSIHPDCGV